MAASLLAVLAGFGGSGRATRGSTHGRGVSGVASGRGDGVVGVSGGEICRLFAETEFDVAESISIAELTFCCMHCWFDID